MGNPDGCFISQSYFVSDIADVSDIIIVSTECTNMCHCHISLLIIIAIYNKMYKYVSNATVMVIIVFN